MSEHTEQSEHAIILQKNGEPFANRNAANLAFHAKKLSKDEFEIVEFEPGSWGIAQKGDTPKPAAPAATEEHTPKMAGKVLCPRCGHKSDTNEMGDECQKEKCEGHYGQDVTQWEEKYYVVMFSESNNPNDPEDVTLIVNGEILKFQRSKEVCIPGRFRECARNAIQERFKQIPGQARKERAPVMAFPFTDLREGTREEFEAQKREGNEATKKALTIAR